jgi:cytochrome c556
MKKLISGLVMGAAALAIVGAALAQTPPTPLQRAQSAAENRHSLFHVMNAAFGPAAGMLRGAPYDAAATRLAGTRLEVLGGMIKQLTATDTTALVPNTRAKPNIWSARADFEAKADQFVTAAAALKNAADEASARRAVQGVAAACKACHDTYRAEEEHH